MVAQLVPLWVPGRSVWGWGKPCPGVWLVSPLGLVMVDRLVVEKAEQWAQAMACLLADWSVGGTVDQ